MNDPKHSLVRQTIENLKLRRMEELGESYDLDKSETLVDSATDSDASCNTADNLKIILSHDQLEHNREAIKSAITHWRDNTNIDSSAQTRSYQNLDTPGMGLELDCLTSFMTAAHKQHILSDLFNHDKDSKSH